MKYLFLFCIHFLGYSTLSQIETEYSQFWSFSNGLARVKKDGQIGYVDTNFNEVISCQFYWANNFYDNSRGLATITDSSNNFGFINRKGNIISTPKYKMVYFFEDSVDLVYVFNGEHYGWMNSLGVEVIPCELDQTVSTPEYFHNGKVRVKKNELYGQMDQSGNITIDCKYKWIDGFDDNNGFPKTKWLAVKGADNISYFYLNPETGQEKKVDYEYAGAFQDGFSMVKKNGLYGFVNESLELVVPCKYKNARDFSEGLASVANEKGKWGLIDVNGKLILDYKYDNIGEFINGKAFVRLNGKEQSQPDLIYPKRIGDRCGYIDRNGKKLTSIKYDDNEFWYKRNRDYPHLVVRKNGKSILMDQNLKRVSKLTYESILFSNRYYLHADILIDKDSNYCIGYRDSMFYPINRDGKEMTTQGSKRFFFFVEGVSMYQDTNELCGFIDYNGEVIIPAEFTYISYRYFKNGTVVMEKGGKKGIINKKGEIIVPFIYDSLENFSDGLAMGKRGEYYYFINQSGEELLRSAAQK